MALIKMNALVVAVDCYVLGVGIADLERGSHKKNHRFLEDEDKAKLFVFVCCMLKSLQTTGVKVFSKPVYTDLVAEIFFC